jgi:hypothetical protein
MNNDAIVKAIDARLEAIADERNANTTNEQAAMALAYVWAAARAGDKAAAEKLKQIFALRPDVKDVCLAMAEMQDRIRAEHNAELTNALDAAQKAAYRNEPTAVSESPQAYSTPAGCLPVMPGENRQASYLIATFGRPEKPPKPPQWTRERLRGLARSLRPGRSSGEGWMKGR